MTAFVDRLLGRGEPVLSEARPGQAAALAALHAEAFRRGWSDDEFERLLRDPNVLAHGATLRGRLIGFIVSRIAADEAEILSVAVAARRRSRGLGARLLDLHLRRLAGLGVLTVFLEVDERNPPARRLYARAGFAEVGRRAGYYRDPAGAASTALVLRRNLS